MVAGRRSRALGELAEERVIACEVLRAMRVSCVHCGFSRREWFERAIVGARADGWFGLPLWLQVPCCGETLFAYNEEHLAYLERFVEATLPERPLGRWRANASVASRLPLWRKQGTSRQEVLHGLAALRRQLATSGEARG